MLGYGSSHRGSAADHAANGIALLAAMATLFGLSAWVIGGVQGLGLALVALAGTLAVAAGLPPAGVMRLHRGVPIEPGDAPELYALVAGLARQAGLDTIPTLYWLPQRRANAVAVSGSAESVIGVSDGLMRTLSPREVAGVLGHEIAHLAAGDIDWLRLSAAITQLTRLICTIGIVACVLLLLGGVATVPLWTVLFLAGAPTGMVLLQLGFSRAREFAADHMAAELTGDPAALASALRRIHGLDASPWGFVHRLQPMAPTWLSTHPDPRERIERLLALSAPRPTAGIRPLAGPWGRR